MPGYIKRAGDNKTITQGDTLQTMLGEITVSHTNYSRQGARIWATSGQVFLASECGCYHTVED